MDSSETKTQEVLELMEAHRQLAVLYNFAVAREHDTHSLAQPSPFEFVPSYISHSTSLSFEGK